MKTIFQAEVAGRAADLDLVIAGFRHPAGLGRGVVSSLVARLCPEGQPRVWLMKKRLN